MKSSKKNEKSINIPFLEGALVARSSRMGDVIRRELATLLAQRAHDPRFQGISVVGLSLSSDLMHARVCISTCFSDVDLSCVLPALNKAKGYFRSQLARQLPGRRVPRLQFVLDTNTLQKDVQGAR